MNLLLFKVLLDPLCFKFYSRALKVEGCTGQSYICLPRNKPLCRLGPREWTSNLEQEREAKPQQMRPYPGEMSQGEEQTKLVKT